MTELKDPYYYLTEYDPVTTGRIQCDISKEDYQFFQFILPSRRDAVIQRTFAILANRLITTLKSYGITTVANADEYRDFITNLKIVDGRSGENGVSGSGALRQTSSFNDRRRVENESVRTPSDKDEQPDVSSDVKRKRTKNDKRKK